jgi:VWFA-related protein
LTKRKIIFTSLVISLVLSNMLAISAQTGLGSVSITLMETEDFPTVDVYLSVNDLDGNPVSGLEPGDFTLKENDVPIPNSDLETTEHPMLIGIVIDSAVSFNTWEGGAPRVDQAKEAAMQLVAPKHGRLKPEDEIAVFAFQNGAPARLHDFSYDHNKVIDQGIRKVSTDGNQYTALFDIVRQAIEETSAREGARRRTLLVFSDGVDETSAADVDAVIETAQQAHLLIYTVGMGTRLAPDSEKSAFLRRLANETGGQYMWYRPGREEEEKELQDFLDQLAAQRAGYILSYTSKQYQGTPEVHLTAQEGGTSVEDTANFEVPPQPPHVSIDNLDNGEVVVGSVTIQPAISRAQRDIDRVEYYLDDELIHTSRAAPWTFEWETNEYAESHTDATRHALRVVVCDIGDQCNETSLTLGARLPAPTPTPAPIPSSTSTDNRMVMGIAIGSLIIALGALVTMITFIQRGNIKSVGGVVSEVRRRTQVWRSRTGIFSDEESEAQTAKLTVISDNSQGEIFPLQDSVIYLGREEDRADIAIYWDRHVSGRHAKISQEGDQFYIWDMNSTNGTWVNEERVRRSLSEGLELEEAHALYNGDVIRLGPNVKLRFNAATGEEPQSVSDADDDISQEEGTPTKVLPESNQGHSPPNDGRGQETQITPRQ